MDNNDFLTAIEKAKERLYDINYSKDDIWFSGSLAMLEACLVELWNTAKKDTIPIEWIKRYIDSTLDDGNSQMLGFKAAIIKEMVEDWGKENGLDK